MSVAPGGFRELEILEQDETRKTIKINPEYRELLPPLPPKEFAALKKSIMENGLYEPISINKDGHILDGHNRYRICKEIGIEIKFEIKHFANKLLEKRFVIETNLQRRHLTTFQRIEMALPLIEIERELAEERMLAGYPTQDFGDGGETLKIVATKIGVSHEIIRQAIWLIENAPEKIGKLRLGERAISTIYKNLMHEKKILELQEEIANLPSPPEGKYQVIVVDPPWPYDTNYDAEGRRGACPYPIMQLEEIMKLELPIDKERCILWLWTTNRFMHDAFHILDAWNFEPKTILTWVKDSFGLGDWLRGQTEHCIMATKGKPIIDLKNQPTVVFGKKRGHSRKPEEFYQLVDSLCFGNKLDYFGGQKREGWDVYGTMELNKNG